jgi:hypothetical protein
MSDLPTAYAVIDTPEAQAARIQRVLDYWSTPLPSQMTRTIHGRPTTLNTTGMSPATLLSRLVVAMEDLRRARDEGGTIRNTACGRVGMSELQVADDAIVLASALAEALAVAFPRKASK